MIPRAEQRMMAEWAGATVVEVAGSDASFRSHPDAGCRPRMDSAQGVRGDDPGCHLTGPFVSGPFPSALS
jgi:hypothetical protein